MSSSKYPRLRFFLVNLLKGLVWLSLIAGAYILFMELVYKDNPERFAQYAERVWDVTTGTAEEKARAGIRCTEEFFKSLHMPVCFTELGIGVQEESMLEYLADMCTNHGKNKVAFFHPIDRQTAIEIYRMANH